MTAVKNAQHGPAATDSGLAASIDGVALLGGGLPEAVRFELDPARRFISNALDEAQKCMESRNADGVPSHLPRASGLLFGRSDGTEITICEIEFVSNVRGSDESVVAEFEGTIAPQFGDVYRNPSRGFWSDEKSVLRAIKEHSGNGLELMGSIHSHPNWHEIGPPQERHQKLSQHPTRMDEYLFRQSCWPVNAILYVRASDGGLAYRVAGWRPGPEQCDRLDIRVPSVICKESNVESLL